MRVWAPLLLLLACGPQSPSPGVDETTTAAATDEGGVDGSTAAGPSTTTTASSVSTSSAVSSSGTDDCAATSPEACTPDLGEVECDVDTQDCPPGWKCAPYSRAGNFFWDGARCVPLARDPGTQGELCLIEDSAYSGIDDCEIGSFCFVVDISELFGVCAALCDFRQQGACAPGLECTDRAWGPGRVCLPPCDPLAQNCGPDQGCYPFDPGNGRFNCMPHSGGAYGSPCELDSECGTGLLCFDAEDVPGCETEHCCTEFCDASVADPDSQCPGAAEGQLCDNWFCDAAPEPALENMGACGLWSCN
jgi:hypothetical protein